MQCENDSTIVVSLGNGTISTIVKLLNFSKSLSVQLSDANIQDISSSLIAIVIASLKIGLIKIGH